MENCISEFKINGLSLNAGQKYYFVGPIETDVTSDITIREEKLTGLCVQHGFLWIIDNLSVVSNDGGRPKPDPTINFRIPLKEISNDVPYYEVFSYPGNKYCLSFSEEVAKKIMKDKKIATLEKIKLKHVEQVEKITKSIDELKDSN